MFGARVIRVIMTDLEKRGEGTPESPIKRIRQYWSLDGKLLWEEDYGNRRWVETGYPERAEEG